MIIVMNVLRAYDTLYLLHELKTIYLVIDNLSRIRLLTVVRAQQLLMLYCYITENQLHLKLSLYIQLFPST
jgi:hypothetical protein